MDLLKGDMNNEVTTDVAAYAWRKLDLLMQVGGQSVPLTVVLRKPFECDDEYWLCAVSLSGLTHRKCDVRAATSEQSLVKAKAFALDELRRYQSKSSVLRTSDNQPIASLSALFA